MNVVKVPQLAWHGTKELAITLPDTWLYKVHNMAGYDRTALTREEIRVAVRKPIGMPPIRDAARGKKEVAIIIDDMSRVTRVAEIVPAVLEELAEAGITDEHIRFITALGCHGAMNRHDFIKKLGNKIVSRFHVYNHNAFGNCTFAGRTSFGTDLYINSEVMKCDFKIAIGSIVPHGFAGYGGGAKIILPGVASIDTARAMHSMRASNGNGKTVDFSCMGDIKDNPLRQNIEEAAALVGLDIKIDAIVNMWGESVSIYAGVPKLAFAEALNEAQSHYLTPQATGCDIVITNAFAKVNEAEGGVITGFSSIRKKGGDLVLISNAPEGHVTHFLLGNWGKISGNEMKLLINLPEQVNHLIVFNEYPDLTITGCFAPEDKVLVIDTWDEVIRRLKGWHGDVAKVAIYPNSEIQYCSNELSVLANNGAGASQKGG